MKIDLQDVTATLVYRENNSIFGPWCCPVCFETFPSQVWHCPLDSHHWPLGRDYCANCHNVELTNWKWWRKKYGKLFQKYPGLFEGELFFSKEPGKDLKAFWAETIGLPEVDR